MKALMYHYVRPAPADLPYFRYLHIDSFRRQLDWIEATHGFVSRDRFLDAPHTGTPANGVVLTFDDAFSDHFLHVFHELTHAACGASSNSLLPTPRRDETRRVGQGC